MTEPAVAARSAGAPGTTVAEWRSRVHRLLDASATVRCCPRRSVSNGLAMSPRNVFVTRAFEVWTHHDDIRRALGRPLTEPLRRTSG
jgi:hypothetical protein